MANKIKIGKNIFELGSRTYIMGILNVTPDSFSDGGKFNSIDRALMHAEKMLEDGVDIIDIGGESTRPGSESISLDEELQRLIPAVEIIRKNFDIPISVDTYKSEVAKQSLESGADIINDISGLNFDTEMASIVSEAGAPIIIMHMQGRPKSMQQDPYYEDVIEEICKFFVERIDFAESRGIVREQIILDPGIGFGKRLHDNLMIITFFDKLHVFNLPLLIGASRKSLIQDVLNLPVDERLEGTLAIHAIAIDRGVNILRVHDVAENRRFVDMLQAIGKA